MYPHLGGGLVDEGVGEVSKHQHQTGQSRTVTDGCQGGNQHEEKVQGRGIAELGDKGEIGLIGARTSFPRLLLLSTKYYRVGRDLEMNTSSFLANSSTYAKHQIWKKNMREI